MLTILEDFRQIKDTLYEINSQALCRNSLYKKLFKPHISKSGIQKHEYSIDHNYMRVERLMKDCHGVDGAFDKEWYDSVSKFFTIDTKEFVKVPDLPLEITRECQVRVVGTTREVSPTRSNENEYFRIRIYINAEQINFSLRKLYVATFNRKVPSRFTKKRNKHARRRKAKGMNHPVVVVNCPYEKGWIKPLYGKMGSEFSPLDSFHESLTEAIKIRI